MTDDELVAARFVLFRTADVSGTSGIGTVAEGIRLSNGKCVLSWLTKHSSIAIYDNMETLVAIHGHDGRTQVSWKDEP